MTPGTAEAIARLSQNFAYTCYRHNYGCIQSVISCRVIVVLSLNDISVSPLNVKLSSYVKRYQQYTNTLIQSLISSHIS